MSRSFFVPDYYPSFACKCGSCRSSCCKGWPVIITGEEYTRLQESECSPDFRKKLNEAFNLDGDPRRGGTAHVVHDRSGSCPLLGKDGLCTLQLELGEGILPDVCPSSAKISSQLMTSSGSELMIQPPVPCLLSSLSL